MTDDPQRRRQLLLVAALPERRPPGVDAESNSARVMGRALCGAGYTPRRIATMSTARGPRRGPMLDRFFDLWQSSLDGLAMLPIDGERLMEGHPQPFEGAGPPFIAFYLTDVGRLRAEALLVAHPAWRPWSQT